MDSRSGDHQREPNDASQAGEQALPPAAGSQCKYLDKRGEEIPQQGLSQAQFENLLRVRGTRASSSAAAVSTGVSALAANSVVGPNPKRPPASAETQHPPRPDSRSPSKP